MKKLFKTSIVLLALTTAFAACKKDPDDQPIPVEQELITTLKLTVTDGGSFSQTFTYKVENGFGNTTPGTIQADSIKLAPNKSYTVTAQLLNEKETPAEDITAEVLEEKNDHLFLHQSAPATGAGSLAFSNGSKDDNNLPFNQVITVTTGNAGTGKLTMYLVHEPTNKNGNTPAASGGETDVEAVYTVIIQ